MIPVDELTGLMQQAVTDKAAEPAFFRALLEATVYAHVPRADRSGRLRFIQFTTPEGLNVLPFFSEEAQAQAAAGSTVTIVALTGRQLFEVTRGATLMLNPNSINSMLYPEEIAALLDHGEVAIVERFDIGNAPLSVGPVSECPAGLIDRLIALYAGMRCVEAAYLAEVGAAGNPARRDLWIAVAVPAKDAERAARATATELQAHCQALQMPVDLTTFVPGKLPDWLKDAALEPFYERAMGECFVPAPKRMQ